MGRTDNSTGGQSNPHMKVRAEQRLGGAESQPRCQRKRIPGRCKSWSESTKAGAVRNVGGIAKRRMWLQRGGEGQTGVGGLLTVVRQGYGAYV